VQLIGGLAILFTIWVMGCAVLAASSPRALERIALMLFARAKAVRAAREEYARVMEAGIVEAAGVEGTLTLRVGEHRFAPGEGRGLRANVAVE
jgi:hypothetical protein